MQLYMPLNATIDILFNSKGSLSVTHTMRAHECALYTRTLTPALR